MAKSKAMKIVWTEPALADLDAIADYIALDNPTAAAGLVQRAFAAAERLSAFPAIGRRVPELPALSYRELIVSPCRILYRINKKNIYIVFVTRGEQLLEEHRLWR